MGHFHDDTHQFVSVARHLHRHQSGVLRGLLNGGTAGALLFIGGLGHLEAGKYAVVSFGVAVDIGHENILPFRCQCGDVPHLLLAGFVVLLADGQVGHHSGQGRGDGTTQGSHTAAAGHGVVTGYFIQKFFYG